MAAWSNGMIARIVDENGRIKLGSRFANRKVIVEKISDSEVHVRLVEVPAREAWLHRNKKAMTSVKQGLVDAKARRISHGPDLDNDRR